MSCLMRPRAHFKGVFTASVPTANNDKVSMTFDEANVQAWNQQQLSDHAFHLWMMQTKDVRNSDKSITKWLNSYFNYFGDNSMTFTSCPSGATVSTAMTSATLADGTICKPEQDLFLLGTVELLGDGRSTAKMVDLDSIGIYGTQIFSGQFRIVVDTKDGPLVMLSANKPTRAYLYNLYFDRNINPAQMGPQMGAGIWQMALPLSDLTFTFGGNVSPTLSALQEAAHAGRGLMVRYVTYYALDGMTEEALAQQYKDSGYKQIKNASTGLIVGTIGCWSNDDPVYSAPADRLLYGTYALPLPVADSTYVRVRTRDTVPAPVKIADATPAVPSPYFLGPITALVDRASKNVVLDFSSAIAEDEGVGTLSGHGDLHKVNYRTLTLSVVSAGRERIVNSIPYHRYDRVAYELTGGIVEVPYSADIGEALADPAGILKLYGTIHNVYQPLTSEITWAAIATDDRCLYLHVKETVTYRMRPLWKGRPMPRQVLSLTIGQYAYTAQDPPNPSRQMVIKNMIQLNEADHIVKQPRSQSYVTDEEGYLTFSVTGLLPGAAMLRYQTPEETFDPNQDGSNSYDYFGYVSYNIFRVLPADNYDDLPDESITWDFVYKNVIRFYYLIYPAMFELVPLQHKTTAQQYASIIATMIAKSNWHNTTYMPVSRDLSDGKRKLLQRWCALNE